MKNNRSVLVGLIISTLILVGASVKIYSEAANSLSLLKNGVVVQSSPPTIKVSVIRVVDGTYRPTYETYNSIYSQHEIDIKSTVSGTVEKITEYCEAGKLIEKGTPLMFIDSLNFKAAVEDARYQVNEAKIRLMEEQKKAQLAEYEWKRTANSRMPTSELVLRGPYVESAKSNLKRSEYNLLIAENDLQNTEIRSPINAVILECNVSPGQYIQEFTSLGRLVGTEEFRVEVKLNEEDWKLIFGDQSLDDELTLSAVIEDESRSLTWYTDNFIAAGHLDNDTKLRSIYLKIRPNLNMEPLPLSGAFAKVTIQGKDIEGLWKLPPSAYDHDGSILVSNDKGMLERVFPKVAFTDSDSIYVHSSKNAREDKYYVLTNPLQSYVSGMKVSIEEEIKQPYAKN